MTIVWICYLDKKEERMICDKIIFQVNLCQLLSMLDNQISSCYIILRYVFFLLYIAQLPFKILLNNFCILIEYWINMKSLSPYRNTFLSLNYMRFKSYY